MQQSASWAANSLRGPGWPRYRKIVCAICPSQNRPRLQLEHPLAALANPPQRLRVQLRNARARHAQQLADFREPHVLVVVADDHLLLIVTQLLDGLLEHPVVAVGFVLPQRIVARRLLLGDAQFEEVAECQVDGGIGQLLQIEVAAVQAVAFGNAFGLAARALAVADVAGQPLEHVALDIGLGVGLEAAVALRVEPVDGLQQADGGEVHVVPPLGQRMRIAREEDAGEHAQPGSVVEEQARARFRQPGGLPLLPQGLCVAMDAGRGLRHEDSYGTLSRATDQGLRDQPPAVDQQEQHDLQRQGDGDEHKKGTDLFL